MTSFFIWRSCDLTGLGAAEAIARNADLINRGKALLEAPSGLPPDDATAGVGEPILDILDASWDEEVDGGDLPPGTYNYNLVPVDTCTGRTGKTKPLPAMTISTAGKRRKLRVNFNTKPADCIGAFVQRDGNALGKPYPLSNQVLDNVPVVSAPSLTGNFSAGTRNTFTRTSGADLVVGDAVLYQGRAVSVIDVSGSDITVDPPIDIDVPPNLADFSNLGKRTGVYFTDVISIPFPNITFNTLPVPTAFPQPWMAFKTIAIPGVTTVPQIGDLITYGSKTALVVTTQLTGLGLPVPPLNTLPIGVPVPMDVAVIPFGLLPLPPFPAGLFYLSNRLAAPFTPSVGLYFDLDQTPGAPGSNPYDKVTVGGDIFNSGAPTDPNIAINNYMGLNGQFVQITNVENGTGIGGGIDLTKARVTFSPGFTLETQVKFPLPAPGGVLGGSGMPIGVYATLPPILSGLFVNNATIASSGSYQRLSRTISITTAAKQWQWDEDGALTERAGTIATGEATAAKQTLDQIMSQAGYGGGLTTLLEKVRGPSATTVNITFNATNGALVRPTGGNRLFAVNGLAREGNGSVIDLANVRTYREVLCGTFKNVLAANKQLTASGFAVQRYENKPVQTPVAACPPGQPDSITSELVCLGLATTTAKVKSGEQVRVFWAPNGRFQAGARQRLMAHGLTDAEASAALELRTDGRVIGAIEFSNADTADIGDLETLGSTTQVDEMLNDDRILVINNGFLTRKQIKTMLQGRGHRGIILRAPGTKPAGISSEASPFINDFAVPVHRLASLLFTYRGTFDVCNFDAAVASIPDAGARNRVAAVFAVVEAVLNGLVDAGRALTSFMTEGEFAAAIDTVAGLISAIAADPTLNCLIGPINQTGFGLPNIPSLDAALQGFAFPFQVRFNLSQLFGLSLQSVLCAVIGELLKLLPADTAAATKRAIGCLPSTEDLATMGFQFPSLDVQVALECSLEQLQLLLDIINELIAEANEVIDFANSFGAGFVFRAVEARNKMCSGDESLTTVFASAAQALGLGGVVG